LPVVGEEREVVAARIERIAEDVVHTDLTAAEVESLPPPR
jgi:hypothetical protein